MGSNQHAQNIIGRRCQAKNVLITRSQKNYSPSADCPITIMDSYRC